MKKYANRERGLLMYGEGKDVYQQKFWLQDGSFSMPVCRIYHKSGNNFKDEVCLSIKINDAKKIIKALEKFISQN